MATVIVIAIVVILAIVVFFVFAVYNGLVRARNAYKNAFAQIDVQLQRRYDLIPNLVETAKAYMAHERETLEAVVRRARRGHRAAWPPQRPIPATRRRCSSWRSERS